MPSFLRAAFPFVLLALIGACAREVSVKPERLSEAKRIAIVSRVEHGPSVLVARSEPGGLSLFPGETDARKLDEKIATVLARKVSRFQVSERLRAGLVRDLPPRPPWTQLVPAVDVASALETLLVDTRDEPPDFGNLRGTHADAVLDLAVKDFGVVRRQGKVGLYCTVAAQLFTLEGRDTIYRRTIDLDDARDGRGDLEPLLLLSGGGTDYRDDLEGMLGRLSHEIALDLGGRERLPPTPAPQPAPVNETPSSGEGDQPDGGNS
jgi:hypothetical protein